MDANITRSYLAIVLVITILLLAAGCSSRNARIETGLTSDVQAQLDTLQAPDGVDAQLFAQLKDAFARAMEQQGKAVSAPPTGPANAPASPGFVDLGGGNYQLVWFYRNIGDYDQSGAVGVPDITPLAIHFGHNGADGLDAVIDVDRNGVGITDITPIAQNFNANCSRYDVESSDSSSGPWMVFATLPLSSGTGKDTGWMQFSHTGAFDPAKWYRITPFDAAGTSGQSCAPIQTTTISQAPSIVSAGPSIGLTGALTTFSVIVSGGAPDSYSWNFGGGATPNTASVANPSTALGTVGTYTVTVSVANAHGNDSLDFSLNVAASGDPPVITNVTPKAGVAGSGVTFTAAVSGGIPDTWQWNFGGGATPDLPTSASPTVTLGAKGNYFASVTAFNAFGSDSYDFTLEVGPGWSFHLIEAGPYVGQQSDICIAEGVPMVVYIEEWDKRVRYARANVPMPASSSDWSLSNVSNKTETWGGNVSISEVGGHVAILANKSTAQKAQYFYEVNCPAGGMADWAVCEIGPSALQVGTLAEVNGFPAVCYYTGDMIYAEATSLAPTVAADWAKVTVDSVGFVGADSKLAVNNGNPYLLYRDSTEVFLRLAYVDVLDRLNASSWVKVDVDEGKKAGEYSDIWFQGDDILIAYSREPQDVEMHFAIGPKSPTSMSHFKRMLVESVYREDVGAYASLALFSGNIRIAYTNADQINLNMASTAYTPGELPSEWQISVFDDGGGTGAPLINGDTHMLVHQNTLILIYRRNDGLWFCSLPLS